MIPAGAIAPGLKADLVLVRLDGFHLQPCVPETLVTNLVHAARGSDVSLVMVDGRIVVEDGRLADVDGQICWSGCAPSRASFCELVRNKQRENLRRFGNLTAVV